MTKAQVIEQMAEDAGISKAEAGRALASFFDSIKEGLRGTDGRIALTGFGTFSKVHRQARQGVSP